MVLGQPRDAVLLIAYRDEWPMLYEQERQRILTAIAAHVLDMQHVGSTAVPGILAKPVLDIGVAVSTFEGARVCIAPLEELGYRYRGEMGIPRRHYFVRGEPRSHQIHMLEREGPEWERMILFRDFLRAHPARARAYADLKRQLAAAHPSDLERYTEAKGSFIERTIEAARRELKTTTINPAHDEKRT